MLRRILSSSRYLVGLAVIGSFLASVTLIVYGVIDTVLTIVNAVSGGTVSAKVEKALVLGFIEVTDVFLLGVVLFIVALGLYSLFIDDKLPLPSWLEIHTLDDLKSKLIGVVAAVLAVLFLGDVVEWDGQRELMGYGIGVAAVIVALGVFMRLTHSKSD